MREYADAWAECSANDLCTSLHPRQKNGSYFCNRRGQRWVLLSEAEYQAEIKESREWQDGDTWRQDAAR